MTGAFPPLSAALLAIIADGAYVLTVGVLLAFIWIGTQDKTHLALRPLLLICAGVLGLADAARPWLLAATMSGSTRWSETILAIPQVLNHTHQGQLWYLSSGAIVVLYLVILLWPRGTLPVAIACLGLMGFAKAASGHAANDGDFTLMAILQTLHIFATAVWAGSVLISGWLVIPRMATRADVRSLEDYCRHLSQAATYAVAVIAISGAFVADQELDNRLSGLWHSAWGNVLTVKLAFVIIALLLGAYNRFVALPGLSSRRELFVRAAKAEAAVMAVVLCLSGILGGIAPSS